MKWVIFFILLSCNESEEMINYLAQLDTKKLVDIPELSTPSIVLTAGLIDGIDVSSFYWFYPYLAADFPEITGITKKYFFLFSTDHLAGGSYWGEGNNLDLSDFTLKGRTIPGGSSETPKLYRVPQNNNKLHLYFHPVLLPQQTDLFVTSGGGLDDIPNNSNWVRYDNPLGLHTLANGNQLGGEDEAHTGYFKMYWINGQWEGRHLAKGGVYPDNFSRFSYSNNGLTWSRQLPNLPPLYIPDNNNTSPNSAGGDYFKFGNQWYHFTNSRNWTTDLKQININTVDEDLRNWKKLKILRPAQTMVVIQTFFAPETNLIHFYFTDIKTELKHATLDVSNAYRWKLD